jgi:hypothetical protein
VKHDERFKPLFASVGNAHARGLFL